MPSSRHDIAVMPEPGEAEKAHSARVLACIDEHCRRQHNGLLTFGEYMRLALYEPGLGYYSAGLRKFGEQGDFVTAPELSPLFSECIANHVAAVLPQLDQGRIIEFGAGSGVMATDMLLRLEKLGCLPQRYYILEVSAELKQRQRNTLAARAPHLLDLVIWLDDMPPEPLNAVVLANEVLDAMPVECFRKHNGRIEQMVIGVDEGGVFSGYREAGAGLLQAVQDIEQRIGHALPQDYCSEVNLHIRPWLGNLYDAIQSGVVLLIDYGYVASEYYHPERKHGTLMCHYHHRAHPDPLWYPGLQDITAYVDFTDAAHAAVDCGFEVRGFTSQAAFLMCCGLADLHAEYVTDDAKQQIRLSQQIKTLTLPSEMGERFKVMALCKQFDEVLPGFLMQDYRGRL